MSKHPVLDSLKTQYWSTLGRGKRLYNTWRFRLEHAGNSRRCPVCGWQGSAFMPVGGEDDIKCPVCDSQPRHRLLKLLLDELGLPRKSGKVLHVSPKGEKGLGKFFRSRASWYLSIDKSGIWNTFAQSEAMQEMDLTDLQLPDNSVDFVCCNNVLEHIQDDKRAIAEIFRVLSPNGTAALTVQIYGETTLAVETPTQEDYFHVWHPGKDYFDRYEEAGFSVRTFDTGRPDKVLLGLKHNVVVPICHKPAHERE